MEPRQLKEVEAKQQDERIYHDYSIDEQSPPMNQLGSVAPIQGNGDHSFPVKLHYMLSEVEKDDLSHVVSWQPHGRSFKVHNREAFVTKLLPCWFRMSHYTSFQRQLNLYGFRRLAGGPDKGGYYHERFLRSQQFQASQIQREAVKGKGRRKPASPDTEPNFYSMPFLPCDEKKVSVHNFPINNAPQCLKSMVQVVVHDASASSQNKCQRALESPNIYRPSISNARVTERNLSSTVLLGKSLQNLMYSKQVKRSLSMFQDITTMPITRPDINSMGTTLSNASGRSDHKYMLANFQLASANASMQKRNKK